MQKCAIVFAGILRPNLEMVRECILNLKGQLEGRFELETYVAAWNSEIFYELAADNASKKYIDYLFGYKKPSSERCLAAITHAGFQVNNSPLEAPHRRRANYRCFWLRKQIVDIAASVDKYDYMVFSRPDNTIKMGNVGDWFNDSYCMPTGKNSNLNFHTVGLAGQPLQICDNFGVAPANIMQAAWNYREMGYVNSILQSSFNFEETWLKIAISNGIQKIKNVQQENLTIYKHDESDQEKAKAGYIYHETEEEKKRAGIL